MKRSVQSIKRVKIGIYCLFIAIVMCTACTPSANHDETETFPDKAPSEITSALPHSVYKEYVIVQDYANNETSTGILDAFADSINKEISSYENAEKCLELSGKQQFIINAVVPFDNGALILGYSVYGSQEYCDLYYFEDGQIIYSSGYSDIWSLNYTVFKDHTIAFGKDLRSDNDSCLNSKEVFAEFANGETASHFFPNIPFKGEIERLQVNTDELSPCQKLVTDGYILIADGQTWIKNIEFYGEDGEVNNDWHSHIFNFGGRDGWEGQPNEIWNTYNYVNMYTENDRNIIGEFSPIEVLINDESIYTMPSLRYKHVGMEYIWRSNNIFHNSAEVKDISQIEIIGLHNNDEVIWVDIDKDDGSPITSLDVLKLDEEPKEKGNYCLIIKPNHKEIIDVDIYYSFLIRII